MKVEHENKNVKNGLMKTSFVFGVKEKTFSSLVAFVMLKTIIPNNHENRVTRPLIEPIF